MSGRDDKSSNMREAKSHDSSRDQINRLNDQLTRQIRFQQLQQLQNSILQQQVLLLGVATQGISSRNGQELPPRGSTDTLSDTPVPPYILTRGVSHNPNIPSSQTDQTNRTYNHAQLNVSASPSLSFPLLGGQGSFKPPADEPFIRPTFPTKPPRSTKRAAEEVGGGHDDGTGSRKRVAHSDPHPIQTPEMSMGTASSARLSKMKRQRGPVTSNPGGGAGGESSQTEQNKPPPVGSDSPFLPSHHSRGQFLSSPIQTENNMVLSMSFSPHNQRHLPSKSPPRSASNVATSATNVCPTLVAATSSPLTNTGNTSLATGLSSPVMEQEETGLSNELATFTANAPYPSPPTRDLQPEVSTRPVAPPALDTAAIINGTNLSTLSLHHGIATTASAHKTSAREGGGESSKSKEAEQKRRDSLKAAFDELRLLLPPIPLSPSTITGPLVGLGLGKDDSDGPPSPGARPPRGPPHSDKDGLNKGVSKLVLLRCGVEFIRDLIGRVRRRDDEIGKLREELKRLRAMLGIADIEYLETDLDKEDEGIREERRRLGKKKRDEDGDQAMAEP